MIDPGEHDPTATADVDLGTPETTACHSPNDPMTTLVGPTTENPTAGTTTRTTPSSCATLLSKPSNHGCDSRSTSAGSESLLDEVTVSAIAEADTPPTRGENEHESLSLPSSCNYCPQHKVWREDTSLTELSEAETTLEDNPTVVGTLPDHHHHQQQHNTERPRPPTTKSVSFSDITFHWHPIILGDSPCVTSGAPLSIGWERTRVQTVDVEAYEALKPPPRVAGQLRIPAGIRQRMLRQAGVSHSDIVQRIEVCDKLRAELNRSALTAAVYPTARNSLTSVAQVVVDDDKEEPNPPTLSTRLRRMFTKRK